MYQEKAKDFYDNVYHANAHDSGTKFNRHFEWILVKLNASSGSSLLDVGCGTGDFLAHASSFRGLSVSGIDISTKAIDICRSKIADGNFICSRGDDTRLPYDDNSFDYCVSMGSLEHFEDIPAAVSEIYRVLRPGGSIAISVPNAEFIGRTLGLFNGTPQKSIKETLQSIHEWISILTKPGFELEHVSKDLHMANQDWVMRAGPRWAPIRLFALLVLLVFPNRFQYQNYYFLRKIEASPKARLN